LFSDLLLSLHGKGALLPAGSFAAGIHRSDGLVSEGAHKCRVGQKVLQRTVNMDNCLLLVSAAAKLAGI